MDIKELRRTIAWLTTKKKEMNLTSSESCAVMTFLAELWMSETDKAVRELKLHPGTIIGEIVLNGCSEEEVGRMTMTVLEENENYIKVITTNGEIRTIGKLTFLLGDYFKEV